MKFHLKHGNSVQTFQTKINGLNLNFLEIAAHEVRSTSYLTDLKKQRSAAWHPRFQHTQYILMLGPYENVRHSKSANKHHRKRQEIVGCHYQMNR